MKFHNSCLVIKSMSSKKPYQPRKKPQQRRSKITTEAILDAAAHILVKNSYSELTTNRIAEKAGVSIGSLYQYYPNKEAIVAELIDQSVEQDRQFMTAKLTELENAPLETAVYQLVGSAMDRCDSNLPLAIALREQIPRVKWTNKIHEITSNLERLIVDLLRSRYSDVTNEQLRKTAFIIVHSVDGIVNETLFSHPDWLSDESYKKSICMMITNYLKSELETHKE